MQRFVVALLAAVDAAIAASVGLALILAPATLLWVLGFGTAADWSALWPATASVWQLGHLVPLEITLPPIYLTAAGIDKSAASFSLSLAPLALATLTAVLAARTGVRASRSEAWESGLIGGIVVFTALAAGVALTGANALAATPTGLAIALPALVFALPATLAAVVTEWREADVGLIARARDALEQRTGESGLAAVSETARGVGIVVAGFIGAGAALLTVALVIRGPQVVALSQAGNADVLGASVIALGQLAYLPTLVLWAASFLAGPGFAVGAATTVAPAGTQVGVLPPVPLLGVIPESTTSWLLLLALVPVALGALAGWMVRSRLVADHPRAIAEGWGLRATVAGAVALLSGGAAALLALVAGGSIGPGALAQVGPAPGAVGLAVGAEVLVGAGILLALPSARTRGDDTDAGEWRVWQPESDTTEADGGGDAAAETEPVGDTPRREAPEDSGGAVDPDQTDTQPLFPHLRRGGGSPLD
ncbi:cell division protein PerM [Microbacterium kunmingense]|uniref:cell division protein PerM n=1 Tax=Microbacterium kunmingense TaxID=2915939 RepID=UPI003D75AE0F